VQPYAGGGILALSLVLQVIKLLLSRSAADISLLWSLLYLLGEGREEWRLDWRNRNFYAV
jgi:hypothetical protein